MMTTKTLFPAIKFVILFASIKVTQSQALQCCGSKLLDSTNNVVLETGYQFTPGTYTAMVIKVCIAEPLQVQIWSRLDNDRYILKWWSLMDITQEMTGKDSLIIPISSLNITADDRLGLYSQGNSFMKIPVPYTDDVTSAIRLSSQSYDRIDAPLEIRLQDITWRRTLSKYVKFCSTPSNCPSIDAVPSTPITHYSEYITIPAKCCNKSEESCNKTNVSIDITILINRINYLKQLINEYLTDSTKYSYCEDNTYAIGTNGVNYCYKIYNEERPFVTAALGCSGVGSRLVFIDNVKEDQFIKDLIVKTFNQTASPLRFFISAVYGVDTGNWFWFNVVSQEKVPFGGYTNWKGNTDPRFTSRSNVCATFTLDESGNFYWEPATCTDSYFYICKIAKLCL